MFDSQKLIKECHHKVGVRIEWIFLEIFQPCANETFLLILAHKHEVATFFFGNREHKHGCGLGVLHQLHVKGGRQRLRHRVGAVLMVGVPDGLDCILRLALDGAHFHYFTQLAWAWVGEGEAT